MAKRKGLKKKETKSNLLFDVLRDIKTTKKGNLLDEVESHKSVSNFMLLKFLSMGLGNNIEIADYLNQYQGVLDKKQFYKLLCEIVPEDPTYDKFISNKKFNIEGAEQVAKYYSISKREATQYIMERGEDFTNEIINKFGGK